jgi:hypothetical protein
LVVAAFHAAALLAQ